MQIIKLFRCFRNQFPPAPASSSIPQWQLAKTAKLQPDQMTEVNGNEILNSSLPKIEVGSTFFNPTPNALDSNVNTANSGKNSTPNGATTSMNYDQNIIQSNDDGPVGQSKPGK